MQKTVEHGHLRTKFYVDANAVSPHTASQMSSFFNDSGITFIDGSIIGGPPHLKHDDTWYRPTIALSGPGIRDVNLDDIFDVSYVGPEIGQASALKMSFASLTKVKNDADLSRTNADRDLPPLQFKLSEQRTLMDSSIR